MKLCRGIFTGHRRETRRLVVAISLSGSAVNFSLTVRRKEQEHRSRQRCCILNPTLKIMLILQKKLNSSNKYTS